MDQKQCVVDMLHDEIVKGLVDQGRLIDAGWQALRALAVPADASPVQLAEMRMAFFAGAQHLFGSIMGFLESDAEPTEADLRRMDAVHAELEKFKGEFDLVHGEPAGHG